MKKMGSINFYNDVNFNIKFNFEDLMDFVFKDKFLKKEEEFICNMCPANPEKMNDKEIFKIKEK